MGIEVMYDYDNTPLQEVSRDRVKEETNTELLHQWMRDLRMLEMEVGTQMCAMDARDDARVPAGRKLGYVRIAIRWVQFRLVELGETADGDPHGAKIRNLNAELKVVQAALTERNNLIKAKNGEILALKHALKAAKQEAINA